MPVARNIEAPGNPDLIVRGDVVEEALERGRTPWAAGKAAMQTDGHHARHHLTLAIEDVERVFQIGVKLVARIETLRRREAHVVGIEAVRHNEEGPARTGDPVRQIIGIAVGRVKKAAFLHGERERVFGAPSLVEAERALAGNFGVNAHGLTDVRALVGLGEILVLDPLQAVARDFPLGFAHRCDLLRSAHHGVRDSECGHRHLA